MSGRGVTRGTGRGGPLPPVAPLANLAIQTPPGEAPANLEQFNARLRVGRGSLNRQIPSAEVPQVGPQGRQERSQGDFDKNRPTYRTPTRFRNFVRTQSAIAPDQKHGTEGNTVRLTANYFSMRKHQDATYTIRLFHVACNPPVSMRAERVGLVSRIKELQDLGYYYDGRACLFVATKQAEKLDKHIKVQIVGGGSTKVDITLEFLRDIGDPNVSEPEDIDMAHGVLNQNMAAILLKLGLVRIGDGFYNEAKAADIMGLQGLSFKLQVWPGYMPLVMQYDGGLLINVDLSSKFLRTGSVLNAIEKIPPVGQVGTEDHCIKATELLRGMVVLTQYNKKAYKIKRVSTEWSLSSTFQNHKTQTNYTVMDYLKAMYNVNPTALKQPFLMCESLDQDLVKRRGEDGKLIKELVPLVPELCWLSGLTPDIRTNFGNMNKILDAARKEPGKRAQLLKEFAVDLNKNVEARETLSKWALEVGMDLEAVNGRELKTVTLEQKGKSLTYSREDADWTRNLRSNKLDEGKTASEFVIAYAQNQQAQAEALYEMLRKVGQPMGVSFNVPVAIGVSTSDPSGFANELKKCVTEKTDMVVLVLPDNKKERYESIKTFLSNDMGVPSQCILVKNLEGKSAMSIATKLTLQINAKMGGPLWHIQSPAVKKPSLVVGIVEGRAHGKGRLLAFVGTTDKMYSRFSSHAATVISSAARSDAYTAALSEFRDEFKRSTGGDTENVIIYRQLDQEVDVAEVTDPRIGELLIAQEVVKKLLPHARLLYCMTIKRCSSRFFSEGVTNPAAGTIVDTKITMPGRKDFFLVSHFGRKGSVMPTYYFVVHDETDITINDFQYFTFQMTHMYFNWSGTIKVPAVCQYAFKMATMCGEITRAPPRDTLKTRLWYL